MIARCLECHSPIFHHSCHCGKCVVRCPDCDGSGRQKTIEFIDDFEGFTTYMLRPQNEACETCRGRGRVSVVYSSLED